MLAVIALMLAVPGAGAKLIDNPEAVGYLHSEVIKEGSIALRSTGFGARASSLEIRHTIPQETETQERELISVEGPDSHKLDEDEHGNEVIILSWSDPPIDQELGYSLIFDVRVWDRDDSASGKDFPTTDLTEPDEGITEKAFDLAQGLTAREKFMALTSYVYNLVEYDRTYQNTQKSARWVFENKMAVCDGHANLLISMLRAIGYDAYYVIGYAYTEENPDPETQGYWGPHGWVEVEHDGKAISLDPTWHEHPVDATHIKFATGPDSNYTEYVSIMASNVELDWDKGDYYVSMLESRQEPRLSIESRLTPETVGSEQHALMITEVESLEEDCVLTRLDIQSCSDRGKPFLELEPEEAGIGLCGKDTLYWFLGTPALGRGTEYLCSVTVYGGGTNSSKELKAARDADPIAARISTQKVFTPGELFTVESTVENTGLFEAELELFLMLGDVVQEHSMEVVGMQAADITWQMRAPREPGDYILRFFSSSGDLVEEEVSVKEHRKVEISRAELPVNITLGETLLFNITLSGLKQSRGELRMVAGTAKHEMDFVLEKSEQRTFTFSYTPETEGTKHVSVVVLSEEGTYEDGFVGSIDVVRDKGWWEDIWEAIRGALEAIFRGLGMSS